MTRNAAHQPVIALVFHLVLVALIPWQVCGNQELLGSHERVLFWGDDTIKSSVSDAGVIDVSTFHGTIVTLDTSLDQAQSQQLPVGVQSIRVILSPSNTFSVNDPIFPNHRPCTQLYVRYQPNYTKKSINHTELAAFIRAVFPSIEYFDTSKMAPVNNELLPFSHQFLDIDPFVPKPKSHLSGFLKTAAPYPTAYAAESAFADGKSNSQSFLRRFFSWYSGDFVQPFTEWGSSFIDMEVAAPEGGVSAGAYRATFIEGARIAAGTANRRVIPPTLPTLLSKFSVYVLSSPTDVSSSPGVVSSSPRVISSSPASVWVYEQDAQEKKTLRDHKIEFERDLEWKVTMGRSIEKQGYHRDLITQLTIQGSKQSQKCNVILMEYFPNDIYVDYDQMSEYQRFGGHPFVLFEHVDVEVTAFNPVASHFVLFVKQAFEWDTEVRVNISVPIHMRYQTPQRDATSLPVRIQPPEVYIQCGDAPAQSPAHAENDFPYSVRRPAANGVALEHAGNTVITIHVPTGKLEDVGVVGIGTAAATLGATAFILFEIFGRRKRRTEHNESKRK